MKRRHNNSVVLTYSICTAGQRLQPYKQLTTAIQLADILIPYRSINHSRSSTSHIILLCSTYCKKLFWKTTCKTVNIYSVQYFLIDTHCQHIASIILPVLYASMSINQHIFLAHSFTSFQSIQVQWVFTGMHVEGGWWIHLPRSLPGSQCIGLGAREGGVSLCCARQFFFLYTISKVRIRKPTHFYWKES